MSLIEALNWRYATKKMNGKAVPQEKVEGAEMTNGKYPVWEVTADNLGALAEKTAKLNAILSKQMRGGKIEKVGVASKTVNGKTYAAVAMTYEVTAKPQK